MSLRWWIRNRLAELLPRWLAVALRIRRLAPAGDYWPPERSIVVPPVDTGGGYRATHRQQNPSIDPTEPYGGESSSVGEDHGWSGCTMTAGADAIAYQQPRGRLTPWGGDLRHRQTDLTGGTDLYDLRTAWADYGETLTIRSGAGWSGVVKDHDAGRALVVQGTGNVPGAQTFDGGHACAVAPETHSDGSWLFGDPLASGWQWIAPGSIRSWMERMSSGCYYAAGEPPPPPEPKPPEPPEPPPEPEPEPVELVDRYADGYARGLLDGDNARADRVFRSWQPGRELDDDELPAGGRWDYAAWDGVVPAADADEWTAWPEPLDMVYRAGTPATWGRSTAWAGAVWRE